MDPVSTNAPANYPSSSGDGYRWKKFTTVAPAKLKQKTPAIDAPSKHQQDYDSGYAEGLAQGLLDGQQQAADQQTVALVELDKILLEVKQLRDRTVADGLQDIAIAFHSLFQQVFLHELRTSPMLIQSLADELRLALQEESMPTIHVSRSIYQSLQAVGAADLDEYLKIDEHLPNGVLRASGGKSILELDVLANLEQVLARACADDLPEDLAEVLAENLPDESVRSDLEC
jgi:hypothetical protein